MSRGPSYRWVRGILGLLLLSNLIVAGCLGSGNDESNDLRTGDGGPITLEVWHTFAAESKEENVFMQSIRAYEALHPNITVEVALVSFGDADNLFMTAAQGGEVLDLMRLSSD